MSSVKTPYQHAQSYLQRKRRSEKVTTPTPSLFQRTRSIVLLLFNNINLWVWNHFRVDSGNRFLFLKVDLIFKYKEKEDQWDSHQKTQVIKPVGNFPRIFKGDEDSVLFKEPKFLLSQTNDYSLYKINNINEVFSTDYKIDYYQIEEGEKGTLSLNCHVASKVIKDTKLTYEVSYYVLIQQNMAS